MVDKKPLFQVIDDAVCNKILAPTISENMKAGKAIEVMQVLNIVIPVEGKGKGKYILKEM